MTTPQSSVVRIEYDGADITNHVLFNSARFECQTNAVPGQATFTIKDVDRTLSFMVGKEVYLYVDDIKMFGGIVMRVGRQLALPVDDTTDLSKVKTRQWVLECLDFNIWFDKRVIRDTTNYISNGDNNPNLRVNQPVYDGEIIRNHLVNLIDVPPGVDMTTYVENVHQSLYNADSHGHWAFMQQGTKWRAQMDQLAAYSASIYYIDADKNLHFESLQSATMDWAFVDHAPNNTNRVACREVTAAQDGSYMVNDALVWGGQDVQGKLYFARKQDTASEAIYGRWQMAEQDQGQIGDQIGVEQRAEAIIDGPPGTAGDVQSGLKYPLWCVNLSWFAHDIPRVAGVPQHIRPGQLVSIILYVMGEDVAHPLNLFLPLLNMTVTFPQLAGGGETWVRFDGEFGLTTSDSRYLWKYILKKDQKQFMPLVIGGSSNQSVSTGYGEYGRFTPNESPDGTRTIFNFPFPMLPSTIEVFVNGLKWRDHYEYEITDANQITFYSPLSSDDQLYVEARTGTG